jgi:hypothetical protein
LAQSLLACWLRQDFYGNKDLLPGAKALRMLDNVVKQLDLLPPVYKDFYTRMLTAKLEKKGLLPISP